MKNKKYFEDTILYRYIISAILHPINFLFCLSFPFYKQYNVWTDKFMGYACTEYDCIPDGWKKAFGKQLSKELKKALKKEHRLHTFRFTQIKEKYGELCLYNNGVGIYSDKVIRKYELLSMGYCITCGKPARYITQGYISYLCEDCIKFEDYNEEELKEARLKVKDLPRLSQLNDKGEYEEINIRTKYGVDLYKLWNLNQVNE